MERRYVEVRSEGSRVSGVALRYGDTARLAPGLEERFEPGAFGPLHDADVMCSLHHRRDQPLGRTNGGGLELEDDAVALRFALSLEGDSLWLQEARAQLKRGLLRGASVEFVPEKQRMVAGTRVIESATLYGFSLVDRPAYPDSLLEELRAHWPREARAARRRVVL